jgi:hypothetical protein
MFPSVPSFDVYRGDRFRLLPYAVFEPPAVRFVVFNHALPRVQAVASCRARLKPALWPSKSRLRVLPSEARSVTDVTGIDMQRFSSQLESQVSAVSYNQRH